MTIFSAAVFIGLLLITDRERRPAAFVGMLLIAGVVALFN